MEPLISIRLEENRRVFAPGETLRFVTQIDALPTEKAGPVETSVLWRTEGKGDEDMGVHLFDRKTPSDLPGGELHAQRRFHTTLPRSPLSYEGVIVKIRWAVRIRAFLKNGKSMIFDVPFQLGQLAPAALLEEEFVDDRAEARADDEEGDGPPEAD